MWRATALLPACLLACTLTALAYAGPPARLRIGDTVPEVKLRRGDSGPTTLSAVRAPAGRPPHPLVVNFFASYCGPCRTELPLLVELVAQWNRERPPRDNQPELLLVPVGIDADPALSLQFAATLGVPPPVFLDPDGGVRTAFDPQRYPCTFLVDAQGVVRHINRGFGPGYKDRVERWLRRMLNAAPAAASPPTPPRNP